MFSLKRKGGWIEMTARYQKLAFLILFNKFNKALT